MITNNKNIFYINLETKVIFSKSFEIKMRRISIKLIAHFLNFVRIKYYLKKTWHQYLINSQFGFLFFSLFLFYFPFLFQIYFLSSHLFILRITEFKNKI